MRAPDTNGADRPNSYIEEKVHQPVTLVWKDIVYSVTYQRKKIKESHLKNQQHQDLTGEHQNFRSDRSISNSSQIDRDDLLEIKDKVDPLAPLIEKKSGSSKKLKKLRERKENMLTSTIFIDPNIPRDLLNKTMPVLKEVSGISKPKEIIGILGPSGCGKTSLLNVLCGRQKPGKYGNLSGEITLNGNEMTKDLFGKVGAFVQQDDVLLSTMTPLECFTFGAALKLSHFTQEEREARIQGLIKDLRLTKCKNTYVGNNFMRGLSGGERKRTSIGYELITNPSLLLLDQPTSGIDSYTSFQIMKMLQKQSRIGRNIIATIHQPSSDIFSLLDKVIVMSRGHFVYFGTPSATMSYLNSIGFKSPKFTNPADYVIKVTVRPDLANPTSPKCLQRQYLIDQYGQNIAEGVSKDIVNNEKQFIEQGRLSLRLNDDQRTAPAIIQLRYLLQRHVRFTLRNPIAFRVKVFQGILTLFFCASLWFETANKGKNIDPVKRANLIGFAFYLSNSIIFPTSMGIVLLYPQLQALYSRERVKKLYGPSGFFWSLILIESIFYQIYPFITSMSYFFIDPIFGADSFFLILAGGFVLTLLGLALGYSFSIIFADEDASRSILVFVILFMLLGSGILVNLSSLRAWLVWLQYISVIRYNIEIILRAVINNFDPFVQATLLNTFSYDLGYAKCFGINIGIAGVLLLTGWLVLLIRSKYV